MPLSFLQIRLVAILMVTGSFLCGCKTTPPNRFYVLNPLDSGVTIRSKPGDKGSLSVEVVSLRLPRYLERPQIVIRNSENQLELEEFHQWGGSLRKNMIRVLAINLSQLLATPDIAISPYRPPVPPDFRVELEVLQFERDSRGQVRLSAQWRLSQGKDRKLLETRITGLASPVVQTGPDFEYTVSAMSILFGELSQIIGREIMKYEHLKPDP